MQGRTPLSAGKRRKKKLKKSVKIVIMILIIILLCMAYIGVKYYYATIANMQHGEVGEAELDASNKDDEFLEGDSNRKEAKYIVCDAEGGEAILIKTGETEVLIDTGTEKGSKKLIDIIKGEIDGKLDYVIITSVSDYRIGGIESIFNEFKVDKVILGEMGDKEKTIKKAIGKNGKISKGKAATIELEYGASLSIFKPDVVSTDIRDKSLMTAFNYKDTRFVALSDAGVEEEAKLVGLFDNCDVVVLSRQGASDCSKVRFGERYAIITNAQKINQNMIDIHANIFSTQVSGTIEFTTDSVLVKTTAPSNQALKPEI